MHIVAIVVFLVILFGPMIWLKSVIRAHQADRSDFPGTGGEFARHILDQLNLHHVRVEATSRGDHYDPVDKAVRLTPANFDGRSLSAVVIAAHEVGHAIQDRDGYKPFVQRLGLVKFEFWLVRITQVLALLPLVGAFGSGIPHLVFISFLLFMGAALLTFGVRLINLNVEYDASFKRALPILENGYIPPEDIPAAKNLLQAAALTYLSGALITFLRLLFLRR